MEQQLYAIGFAIVLSLVAISIYENPQKWIDFFTPAGEDGEEEEDE